MYSETLTKEIKKIIKFYNLDCTVKEFENHDYWFDVSGYKHLSEEFIEKFQDKVDWDLISQRQRLSEYLIEKFKDKVDWHKISCWQKLSESFIEKFKYRVYWDGISRYQKLSESFIEKFQDRVNWQYILKCQNISESFIEKFQDEINWCSISGLQKLSEEFIEKFQDKVWWSEISKYQKLSESFIEKFKDEVCWTYISKYQKLSPQFRKKYKIKINKNNWMYKPVTLKLKYIQENTNYKVIDNKYIIAYKGIRRDNYSNFNFQYKYEVGKTYEAHCDCNADNQNSFGLSAWYIEKAKDYCDEKILKVKIAISDIGCIVLSENKIRCFRLEVLEEVKDF